MAVMTIRAGAGGELASVRGFARTTGSKRLVTSMALALSSDRVGISAVAIGKAVAICATASAETVKPIPGPSAVTAALSAAGIATPQWLFLGFLPAAAGARRAAIERAGALPYALVLYEAPHRIAATVAVLAAALDPKREIVIARKLTKRFETLNTCALADASAWLAADAVES